MGYTSRKINIILLFFLIDFIECLTRVDPLVNTEVGLIRGIKATDGEYSMFMGIPFAQVDEDNPFGDAKPQPPFENTFEAFSDSAICPQRDEITNSIVGTLDCLHLNVYVPSSASTQNRLPVLVWIHGGGFSMGFAGKTLYGPKYLVRHDVIIVTTNYRLGPYGFMCLDIPDVPGNQGLKDQLLGLRWVKNNIAAFGGDETQITIMGESAGGMSVDLHLYSETEKLFNRVIIQSGTAFSLLSNPERDLYAHFKLANELGFMTNDTKEALAFLASTHPTLLIAASEKIDMFMPCVEQKFENVVHFITDHPKDMKIPKIKGMPVLIGVVEYEFLSDYLTKDPEFYKNLNIFGDSLSVAFNLDDETFDRMEEIVRNFYIGDAGISIDKNYEIATFHSDLTFFYPTKRAIDKYLENNAGDIFKYMFSYVGQRNWVRWHSNITEGGAVHADEIGYLFDVSLWNNDNNTSEDQLVIDRMTKLWTNFAKYGDPTPSTTELLPVKWQPITSKEGVRTYLKIDANLSLSSSLYHDRMSFWDLFFNANKIIISS